MKIHLKNLNLNRLRQYDKEAVRETKHILKNLLVQNMGKPSVLANLSEKKSLDRPELKNALQQLGHNLTEDQVDIMMYYINPYHGGKITKDNINKAAGHLQRFDDNVTTDLRDGVSVASSRLGSVASYRSAASVNKQVEKVKKELEDKALQGVVSETEFRDVITREFPLLRNDQLDTIVHESAKKPNKPEKIYDEVIPKQVMENNVKKSYIVSPELFIPL